MISCCKVYLNPVVGIPKSMIRAVLFLVWTATSFHSIASFCIPHKTVVPSTTISSPSLPSSSVVSTLPNSLLHYRTEATTSSTSLSASSNNNNKKSNAEDEKARLEVWTNRRRLIRSTLRSAERLRNFRLDQVGDADDNTTEDAGKSALTATAFVVAGGAVLLRVGGRAALVSSLGLDFAKESPELQGQMDTVLQYLTNDVGLGGEVLLFVALWTLVKVFLFDAGGIVLALSAGILFGGVLQGALMSAAAATVGSTVAFLLAKLDSPVRNKALELLDEYPSLRGIEKVVARDGIKAVLTLRLAPVLPIPIGAYNYVYGVTNVPILDFMTGIFLGSFKPYLLDSYLGIFGKNLIEGTTSQSDTEDSILLVALGISVLIGVFASQLATETWEQVRLEMEQEQREKTPDGPDDDDDRVSRSLFGLDLPQWTIRVQLSLRAAERRMEEAIQTETVAQVWNFTNTKDIPDHLDPAQAVDSPEVLGQGKEFEFVNALTDGLVLSPVLFKAFLEFADPAYDLSKLDEKTTTTPEDSLASRSTVSSSGSSTTSNEPLDGSLPTGFTNGETALVQDIPTFAATQNDNSSLDDYLFETLDMIRKTLEKKIEDIELAEQNDSEEK